MADDDLFIPVPTPETQHFWEGTRQGELRLQRCLDCGHVYFPPRPFCPLCMSRNVEVFAASGRGTLASYVISHRRQPNFEPPYSVAMVELEEGPRIISNIVGCEQTPETLQLDMPLEAVFRKLTDEIHLVQFRPAGMSS